MFHRFLSLAVLPLVLLLTGCFGQSGRLPAPPVSPADLSFPELRRPDGSRVTAAAFRTLVVDYDYVVVGEEHPNPCHHQAQAALLREARKAYRKAAMQGKTHLGLPLAEPVLALEMLPAELNARLAALDASATPRATLDATLPNGQTWRQVWGYPFALYAPVFAAADAIPGTPLTALPVRGLNLPRRVIQAAARGGLDAVAQEDRRFLPTEMPPLLPEQVEAWAPWKAQHAERLDSSSRPSGMSRHFELVMRLWDNGMGQEAVRLRYSLRRPIFALAGAGHLENRWGMIRAIEYYDASADVLTILPVTPGVDWPVADAGDARNAASRDQLFVVCPPQRPRLGLMLETPAEQPHGSGETAGLLVREVAPGSAAERAGFRAGDVILAINGQTPAGVMDLHTAAIRSLTGPAMRFLVLRADGGRILLRAALQPPRPNFTHPASAEKLTPDSENR